MRNLLLGSTYLRNVADAPGGAAAPVVVEPVVAPAAPAIEPAAVVDAPAVPAAEVAPVVAEPVVAVAEPAKPDAHAEPSLLEGAKPEGEKAPEIAAKPDEVKPAEPAKVDGEPAKPAAEVKPAEVVAAPVVYDLKLPDGFTAQPAQMDAVREIMAANKVAPEAAQSLIDQHVTAMNTYRDNLASEQHRVFSETRAAWRAEVTADSQIGGSGHNTAMQAIARMRDKFVPETERTAFNEFLRVTGAGDHPQFLKLLHTAARYFDEPSAPSVQGNPAPSNGQRPGGRGLKGIYAATNAARAAQ